MKAQQVINYLPNEEIKGEVLKSKNLFIKLILKPLLDKVILIIIEAILKKFNLSPKLSANHNMADGDPDPGTTPDPPQ